MTPMVRREAVFSVPPQDLWRALTDPEALAQWFANDVELDARPGGVGIFRWSDGAERRATVELVEERRVLGFRWEDEQGHVTRVRLRLVEEEGNTRLSVTETAVGPEASALVGEWSWGVQLLAALPRLRRLAHA